MFTDLRFVLSYDHLDKYIYFNENLHDCIHGRLHEVVVSAESAM